MDKRYAAMTPGSVNPSINSPRFGKLETLINCVNQPVCLPYYQN